MSELYKALNIEDSLTTLESRFYEKEEVQNFISQFRAYTAHPEQSVSFRSAR